MSSDIELYKEFLLGNMSSFDELMDKYRANLIYFINGFVKNLDVAEDLAQDVFVYILINRREYDFKYSMKTYLYTIARSRSLNYLKRQKIIKGKVDNDFFKIEYITDFSDMEENLELDERSNKLYKAINMLNDNQARAIFLADIEELSYKEICKITGETNSQLKMVLFRARKNLKKYLSKEEFINE